MLKPSTIEALKDLVAQLEAEREQLGRDIEALKRALEIFDRAQPAAAPAQQPKAPSPATVPPVRRGLPRERPGERRCGNCGSVGHRRDKCPKNPLRDSVTSPSRDVTLAPTPLPAPSVEGRVCAVHEAPATPLGRPKPNGRQTYTCPLGCETENTMVRRRASA